MQGGDGSVFILSPHGEKTLDIHSTDLGIRCWWRGSGDTCGVLTTGTGVGEISGRQVPGEGGKPREDQLTLHVSALKVKRNH